MGDVFRATGFMRNTRTAADRVVNSGCKTFNDRAGTAGLQLCPGGEAVHIDHVWVIRTEMRVERYGVPADERTSRASDHDPVTTILERR